MPLTSIFYFLKYVFLTDLIFEHLLDHLENSVVHPVIHAALRTP